MLKIFEILSCPQNLFLHSLLDVSQVRALDNDKYQEDYPNGIDATSEKLSESVSDILDKPTDIQTINGEDISILDYSDFEFNSDQSLKEFCSHTFRINLNKKKGIETINQIYKNILSLFEKRYLRQVPDSLKTLEFKSVGDLREFLSNTGKGKLGIYRCMLAKIFFSYAKTVSETRFSEIKPIHDQVKGMIFKTVSILSEENVSGSQIVDSKFLGESCGVEFNGFSRYKTLDSIVGKEIANTQYNTLESYKDLHGFTFVCKTKKDLLLLLQQYYHSGVVLDGVIENKGCISIEDLNSSDLDEGFKAELIVALAKSEKKSSLKKKEKGNSHRYKEIKIKGGVCFVDPKNPNSQNNKTGVEIKFQLEDNENEYGTSFHPILDYQKRIRELIRLGKMVRQKDIINFVNDFFETLDRNLELKGKDRNTYMDELCKDLTEQGFISDQDGDINESDIALGLYKYFIRNLQKVKTSKKSSTVYFVNKKYLNQADAGLQKELVKL